jgi:ABC-type Fe3+-hydroxamate transport system substrate-binding protein
LSDTTLEEIKEQILLIGKEVKELNAKLDAYVKAIKDKVEEVVEVIGL